MLPVCLVGLILLFGLIVMYATFHSSYAMRDEFEANPRRFLSRLLGAPLILAVLAGALWLNGPRFYVAAIVCLLLSTLAVAFWNEL